MLKYIWLLFVLLVPALADDISDLKLAFPKVELQPPLPDNPVLSIDTNTTVDLKDSGPPYLWVTSPPDAWVSSDNSSLLNITDPVMLYVGDIAIDVTTGKVEIPPTLTRDEAALAFWEAVAAIYPKASASLRRKQTDARDDFEHGVVFALLALRSNASLEDTLITARKLRAKVEQALPDK